jgi:hypothetical protein
MYRRIAPAGLAVIAAVTLAFVAGCAGGESYSDKTDHCASALKVRTAGDTSKPKECEGVKDDDYQTLVVANSLHSSGVVDDDGNVDLDKLLSPTDTP